ncbi:MAG: hypothetical protein IR527_00720 [Bacteroides sp.]|nr:MAG: hypothetical protein IR527_00720 [Bacteroides sp.]
MWINNLCFVYIYLIFLSIFFIKVPKKYEKIIINNIYIDIYNNYNYFNKQYISNIIDYYKSHNNLLFNVHDFFISKPLVESITIYFDVYNNLYVKIYMKNILIKIENIYKKSFFIDFNGYKIDNVHNDNLHTIVNAYGFITEYANDKSCKIKSEIVIDIYKISLYIKNSSFWVKHIKHIYVNKNIEIELTTYINNHIFLIGNSNDINEKMDKIILFYQKIINRIDSYKYLVINLKYKNQIICSD